ncbi:MAG TPA: hypothetical protein VMN36_15475 [Verrucomicrobiales bacterium]|nr:hypothetical protein [Verrucomicrobiales bacterium]
MSTVLKRLLTALTFSAVLLGSPAAFPFPQTVTDPFSEHSVDFRGVLYRQTIRNGRLQLLKTRLTSKDVLRILELELNRVFARGAKLVVFESYHRDNNGNFSTSVDDWSWCVNSGGDLIDVTEYFAYIPAPLDRTAISEGRRTFDRALYGVHEVLIGTAQFFFEFRGLAEFKESASNLKMGSTTETVVIQSVSMRDSVGEAQIQTPRQIFPMTGSFSISRGQIRRPS